MEEHRRLQNDAVQAEAEAQRALLAGEDPGEGFATAAELYRRSWAAAPPGAYGRLVGMLKAAVIGGSGERDAAGYARGEVGEAPESPTAAYALAVAALVEGDDATAESAADAMRAGGETFARAADAVGAIAREDSAAYGAAVRAIVADFEGRDLHLTKVPIADTALMLERLAEARGLAVHPDSALLP